MEIEFILVVVLGIILYFIPVIIALSRNHSNQTGIFLLNLFLGWTFLGWLGALIWSLTTSNKQTIVVNNNYSKGDIKDSQIKDSSNSNSSKRSEDYENKLEHLQKLKQLLDSGVLSEKEFTKEKGKILKD